MSQMKKKNSKNQNIAAESIIPLLGVIFTLYYISSILDAPWTAQVNAFLIGSVLLFVTAIFFIKKGVLLARKQASFQIPLANFLPALKTPQTAFITISFLYLLILDFIGFTAATVMFFWSSMIILDHGKKPVRKVCLSVAMALIGYIVFIVIFETRLPTGVVEEFMTGVVF